MIILENLKIKKLKKKIRHHMIGGEARSFPFYLKLRGVRLEMEMFQIK
jgi:hypothetical protein